MTIAQTLADAPEVSFGDESERKLRTKLANALILQGSSTEPVKSWTQGAARVAQALTGGFIGGDMAREGAADEARTAALLSNLPGMGGTPGGASPRYPAPVAGPPGDFSSFLGVGSPIEGPARGSPAGPPVAATEAPPLALTRERVIRELQDDPGLQAKFDANTTAEVGKDPAKRSWYQALTIDRAVAEGKPLSAVVNDPKYYPPRTTNFKESAGIPVNAALAEGANPANFATGNASRDPRTGREVGFAGGPQTSSYGSGSNMERGGIEGRTLPYARAVGYTGPDRTPIGPNGPTGNNVQLAQGPQTSVASGVSTITPNQIDPATGQFIKALISNKGTRKFGEQMYQHFLTKSKDQMVQETDANGIPFQRNVSTGERKADPTSNPDMNIASAMIANPTKYGFKGPDDPALLDSVRKRLGGMSTSVSVNNVAEPILKGIGEQYVTGKEAAEASAYKEIPAIHEARKALDQGAVTGAFASGRLDLTKVGSLFGFDSSKAQNTEVLRSSIGEQVLAKAKTLGANPSNTDRDYIEKVVGGQIALEEGSIRKLLDMQEKWARDSIVRHNRKGEALIKADPERYRAVAPLMTLDMPGEYQKSAPPAGAAPAGGGGVRKYNPATGKIE